MWKKSLIVQLKKSNHLAFKKLFDAYYPKVKGFLTSLGLIKEFEDVIQETFISVWQNRDHIDLNKSFDSYIFTIAKNNALKALKKKVEIELDTKFDNIVDFSTSSECGIDFQYYKERIESSLASLPPQSRRVFEMKRLRGMSTKEVANELNLSPKTVENYMNRALNLLKEDLGHLALSLVFFAASL